MKYIIALCLVSLAGCASTKKIAEPVEVKVPVPVPCKVPDIQRPVFAVESLDVNADIWDMMSALRAERHQRRGYEMQLEASINACKY
jgi:hypothetical protein